MSPRSRARSIASIGGHPAQHLRGGELLGVASDLPDALVGIVAVCDGVIDEPGQALPHVPDDLLGLALVQVGVDRVEEHAPNVVLMLVPGAVSDPHRTRPPVTGEVVEGALGQVPLTADAVHDLELERFVQVTSAHRLEYEAEVLERLPVEAQPVQRAQHERGVPDPGVAVVPVAGPARGFRQRGGRARP